MALPPRYARQVRALNCLMAAATGSERDKTVQVERAITYGSRSRRTPVSTAPFATVAQRLFAIHNAGIHERTMQHLDLQAEDHEPLWLVTAVQNAVANLSRHREGLLLITGLKGAICGFGQRFTARRQREYEVATHLIYTEVARLSEARQTIHVIVL